jgi:hypothetical protein
MELISEKRVERELSRFKKKDVSSWAEGIADRLVAVRHATVDGLRAGNLGLVRTYANQAAVSALLHGRSDADKYVRLAVWSSRELAQVRPSTNAKVLRDKAVLLISFLMLRGDLSAVDGWQLQERTSRLFEKMPEQWESLFEKTTNVLLSGGSDEARIQLWHLHRSKKLIDVQDVLDFCTPVSFVRSGGIPLSADQMRIVDGYRIDIPRDWSPY